ncbi:Glutamate N-acetyltransferase / Amino-acid acetyltransferase [Desulfovibrionales bacterium]
MISYPQGYRFAVAAAGFKTWKRTDLGLVISNGPANVAAMFTTNAFQAAPILIAREHLAAVSQTHAVVINAGQANACTGDQGLINCRTSLELVARATGLCATDILPASTGVIGVQLPMDKWTAAMPTLVRSLNTRDSGPIEFARTIMTTDQFPKLAWETLTITDASSQPREVRLCGIAKGAGMICPNMATMLAVLLTDAQIAPDLLRRLLNRAVNKSFSRITVDGGTSTNDAIFLLANGHANVTVSEAIADAFDAILVTVCRKLAYQIVEDAEGGTKVLRIVVSGASSTKDAALTARTVGNSLLVKTAFYGKNPNWGRIVAAIGHSGAAFNPKMVTVSIAKIPIFNYGQPVTGDIDSLFAHILRRQNISLEISLGDGPGRYTMLAADLSHDYVSLNADYQT